MPDPSSPPAADHGVIRQVRHVALAIGQYISARARLAGLEGKEAAAHGLRMVLLVAALLALAVFGWLFVCLGVVSLLAGAFARHGWLWASLIMAGGHFVLVFILASVLKAKAATPIFPLTTEELQKDQVWLEQQTKQL